MADATRGTLGLTAIAVSCALVSSGCGAGGAVSSDIAEAPAPAVNAFMYAPFAASYRLTSHGRTEQERATMQSPWAFSIALTCSTRPAPRLPWLALCSSTAGNRLPSSSAARLMTTGYCLSSIT